MIVFASISLAYGISELTGKVYIGFLSVAVLYLIAGMILFSKKKSMLEKPVIDTMIKNFFNEGDHESN